MDSKTKKILVDTPLFKGFNIDELNLFLQAFPPIVKKYGSKESVILAGYENKNIGIVLSGRLEAAKESKSGGTFIVARLSAGSVIGDVLSGGHNKSPVTVSAVTPCTVLFLCYPALLDVSKNAPEKLLRIFFANLVAVISDKYFSLDKRIDLLLMKTLRQKIAADILRRTGQGQSADTLRIPYSQSSWAAYLGCERSALSREISRMAKDGLIRYNKRTVTIIDFQKLEIFL